MAIKPFTFGLRLRDKGRTVRVSQDEKRRYVVEDSQKGRRTNKRAHRNLGGAIQDAARDHEGWLIYGYSPAWGPSLFGDIPHHMVGRRLRVRPVE